MAKVIENVAAGRTASKPHDWRKSMSDHVAFALIVYTALQIFLTVHALQDGLPSILPYVTLVLLVAAIIPACRWFERRWRDLPDEAAADIALRPAFRRDILALWLLALGLPPLITALFRLVSPAT